jgi:beta-glucanase (GH16 family)
VNDLDNTFIDNGNLHIRPTLTSDYFGEAFLTSGRVVIPPEDCTNTEFDGCDRQGSPNSPLNPVRSARIRTMNSFSFKYGTLEVRAKMPAGDWLWPAIWLLPTRNVYGGWPRSGEIDLLEARGNRKLFLGKTNVGVEQFGSTLHFGPHTNVNGWRTANFAKNQIPGFDEDFHTYKLYWTPEKFQFFLDDKSIGTIKVGKGFWERGNFNSSGFPNLWQNASINAPFDQEFHIILNLAVGGNGFFSDSYRNEKPWKNTSPNSMRDFWNNRKSWLPTWNYGVDDSADFVVDYVRVWAL